MKINKFLEELRAKSDTELKEELVAAKKELFNLRFQNATNQLDNTSRIKEVRRNIARICSCQNFPNSVPESMSRYNFIVSVLSDTSPLIFVV